MSGSCAGERAYAAAQVLANRHAADGVFELVADWKGPAPAPGQFFMVRPKRGYVYLGRPISVYSWEPHKKNEGGALGLLIALRGAGTRELSELRPGEEAELIGPLGNDWTGACGSFGFPAPTKAKPVALVGGGIGVAPVAFLARGLDAGSYDFYAGFRSRSYGLDGLEPRTQVLASEDGAEGERGRIPDYLDAAKYAAVYACGPDPMLKAVAAACAEAGVPCAVSMERRMACGVGACLGCVVPTKSGNRRCCVDGPVFDAREVYGYEG